MWTVAVLLIAALPVVQPAPDFCDFERDFCKWHDYRRPDNFYWTRSRGLTNSWGPPVDHTIFTSTGYYLLASGRDAVAREDEAQLVSDVHDATMETTCLKFFYNLNNDAVRLTVSTSYQGHIPGPALWQARQSTGGRWVAATVAIPAQENSFEIIITASAGGEMNYAAIDDIIYFAKADACLGARDPPVG